MAPLEQHRGNVTVVSLVQASCSTCRKHVEHLGRLHSRLLKLGLRELSMVGINSKHQTSRMMLSSLRPSVSFPLLQDTHNDAVWSQLGAHKDDVLVYDRCGRLTAHVTYPKSHVTSNHVEAAIMWTYFGNPCGTSCLEETDGNAPSNVNRPQPLPSTD